ncbi:glycosyltransferase, partial [Candidatus Woesearchaeota archaeon]|nr:glycosyltransferase [Candidatus Woesearchaeota archaeon]
VFERFLIINDGSDHEVGEELNRLKSVYGWLDVRSSSTNLGLCMTLWNAYQGFAGMPDDDIVVRLDSDGEHDPKMIPVLLEKIRAGAAGAICQVKYREEHQSKEDRLFNLFAGSIQGKVIFGRPLTHNCPGFNAYRGMAVKAAVRDYPAYSQEYVHRFGVEHDCLFEIVMAFLVTRNRFSIDTTTFHESRIVAPNRPTEKMLEQSIASARNLVLMQELDRKSGFRV